MRGVRGGSTPDGHAWGAERRGVPMCRLHVRGEVSTHALGGAPHARDGVWMCPGLCIHTARSSDRDAARQKGGTHAGGPGHAQ